MGFLGLNQRASGPLCHLAIRLWEACIFTPPVTTSRHSQAPLAEPALPVMTTILAVLHALPP